MEEKEKEEHMLIDREKPALEAEAPEIPEEMFEMVHPFEYLGLITKEEGIEYCFGLCAGGNWAIEGNLQRAGVKRVHVRHEQAATFAAEAWGRLSGRPGLAVIGPGTGLTNSASGVANAWCAQAPMVVLVGESGSSDDDRYHGQGEVRAERLYQGITKWVRKVHYPQSYLFQLKRAFRAAVTPPSGPVAVATGYDWHAGFLTPRMMMTLQYTPGLLPRVWETHENPALVKKTLEWLLEGERPAIVVGEGIQYDHAEEELREFVGLLGIPCHARRISRGAISEYDDLNCYGRARGRIMAQADRAMVMGLRITYLENWGQPPFWSHNARYAQVQTCQENVDLVLPTEFELIGNMKSVLRQFIDCARDMGIKGPQDKWATWRKFVVDTKQEYMKRTLARTEAMKGKMPLHPDLVGRLTWEFLRDEYRDDYIVGIDGFTASSFFTDWNRCIRSGQVLDATEEIGLGHSVGYALAAGLFTDRKKPYLAVMGDGAVGAAGMDIETVSRWNIPAVFMHENNNSLVGGGWKLFASSMTKYATGNQMLDSWETLPNIRYERMFKEFGCHAEFVDRDEQFKPALKRAFDFAMRECKPAFVEVHVDPTVLQEIWGTGLTAGLAFVPWDEVPDEGKQAIVRWRLVPPEQYVACHPSWGPGIEEWKEKMGM